MFVSLKGQKIVHCLEFYIILTWGYPRSWINEWIVWMNEVQFRCIEFYKLNGLKELLSCLQCRLLIDLIIIGTYDKKL